MERYSNMYKEFKALTPSELLQLADNSSSYEEKSFYYHIMNFFLQQRQAEVVKKGIF